MKADDRIEPATAVDSGTDSRGAESGFLRGRGLGLYDRGRWLWRGLAFGLEPGERLALSGPSGSGKTALLRSIAGLMPVTEGEIHFRNRPLSSWSLPIYRTQVGYLQQRPMLDDGDTVQAVLAQPFEYRAHRDHRYPEEQVQVQLQMLGQDADFLKRPVESLSGGEQQITALLRLLALGPSLLLLDEPTASLDRQATLAVESLLDDWLERQPGSAMIWVGHDAGQSARMTNRQLELNAWKP